MKKLIVLFSIALFTVTAGCSQLGTSAVEDPYRKQIVELRSRIQEIRRKVEDLTRQIQELQVESNWSNSRINSVANEALTAKGLSTNNYVVDVDKLIYKRK